MRKTWLIGCCIVGVLCMASIVCAAEQTITLKAFVDETASFSVRTDTGTTLDFGICDRPTNSDGSPALIGFPGNHRVYIGVMSNNGKKWVVKHEQYNELKMEDDTKFDAIEPGTTNPTEALKCVVTDAYDYNGNNLTKYPQGKAFTTAQATKSSQVLFTSPDSGAGDAFQMEYFLGNINPNQKSGTYTGSIVYSLTTA